MAYTKVGWTETTPVNVSNLDQMDQGIKDATDMVESHKGRHQEGGSDQIDVTNLTGVLADDQPPQAHDNSKHNNDYTKVTDFNNHKGNSSAHHTRYSDSEAISAINNDGDHGSTAPHNYYTDSKARSAINNDGDHGSTASHNYFSGDHRDLSNVYSNQHHDPANQDVESVDGYDVAVVDSLPSTPDSTTLYFVRK